MAASADITGPLEWSVAARSLDDAPHSGDLHLVAPFADSVLVAVIDGLGHGPEAALAAETAAACLAEDPAPPPSRLIRRCHEALRRTRGAVMSLAVFDTRQHLMTWAGVGDVEAMLLRADGAARESILLRGGVVGYQLPPLRDTTHPIRYGDLLLIATDGVRSDFASDEDAARPVGQIAEETLARHAKGSDDALVLAARYLGGAA